MPVVSPCPLRSMPVAAPGGLPGGDGVEVAAQSIAGEGGYAVFVQTQTEIVEEGMSVLLLASTQMKRGDDLCDRVNGQPEPLDASPDFGVQFVELDEGEDQALEVAVVQQDAVRVSVGDFSD